MLFETLASTLAVDWAVLLFALAISFCVTGFFALSRVRLGTDKDEGVQKFHVSPTSRLGGVGIASGLIAGVYLSNNYYLNDTLIGSWLLLASLPVFLGGLIEDFTHKVSPRKRLFLACLSAALVYGILDVGVTRTDIAYLDEALAIPGVALVVTVLVVAGFINSVNIIDGFHGLASGAVIIMLLGMAVLAMRVDDGLLFRLCLIAAVATLGFATWNWPFGKIFLGDGGAYLLGLLVVEFGLMLPHRTHSLSPMAPVLVGVYPLLETLYSMYRRKFIRSHPVNHPDALHLHTLIYRRLILNPASDISSQDKNRANAQVALVVWGFVAVPAALSVYFYEQTYLLLALIGIFTLAYVYFYQLLIKFKAPKFLMSKNRRGGN